MGLLDKFNRGMQAVETGLLGNATAFNPALSQYLSPGTLNKANQDARMQLGLAMLAASESGMGFGQGLMMAQQVAGQAFRQPMETDLQDKMRVDALQRMVEQRDAQEKLKQQIALFRQQNPEYANEPDNIILKRMDPSFGMDVSRLALDQQQVAETIKNNALDNTRADEQLELQRRQMMQAGANADRQYELERLKMQAEEQRFRAQLKAAGSKVDPTEARQRRDKAGGALSMLNTLDKLKAEVETHGTELFGSKAGVQGSLYGQALSEYKQAKQLGTLDKGLLDLFDKMLADPTSWGSAANPFAKSKILSQLDTLITETEDQYNRDYSYLKANGVDDGFQPRQPQIGSAAFLRQLEQEGAKRKLW